MNPLCLRKGHMAQSRPLRQHLARRVTTPRIGGMNRRMNASAPKATVLLSTYNGARWLPELIDSIEAQTFTQWQVLARDDGSNDASNAIMTSWAKSSQRVRLESPTPHIGPSRSFMHLLSSLDSAHFAFCDQDDVWHPDRLEVGLDHLAGRDPYEDEVAVSTAVDVVDARLTPVSRPTPRGTVAQADFAIGPLLLNNAAIGATMMGTAALARSAIRLAQDGPVGMHDWWCALVAASRGSLVFDRRATLQWRRHKDTYTGTAPRGLKRRLQRRRAYLLDARDMAQRLLTEPDAIVSDDVFVALGALARTEPTDLSLADYRRLDRVGASAKSWRRRATLLAACVDRSGATDFGLGTATPPRPAENPKR